MGLYVHTNTCVHIMYLHNTQINKHAYHVHVPWLTPHFAESAQLLDNNYDDVVQWLTLLLCLNEPECDLLLLTSKHAYSGCPGYCNK